MTTPVHKDQTPADAGLDIRPVAPPLWPDLRRLFGDRGACAGCWCMWWRLPRREFALNQGSGNEQALKRLVEAGRVPGLLAYAGGEPVAWCSLGPREDFPNLNRSRTMRRLDDKVVWSVVCLYVTAKARRRGVARALLKAAVEYARRPGVEALEGYPVAHEPGRYPSGSYMGTPGAFESAGFVEAARTSKVRRVMRYYYT